jgi:hypothetical protein
VNKKEKIVVYYVPSENPRYKYVTEAYVYKPRRIRGRSVWVESYYDGDFSGYFGNSKEQLQKVMREKGLLVKKAEKYWKAICGAYMDIVGKRTGYE